jgi:acetyl-CoA C-acetyltransferase
MTDAVIVSTARTPIGKAYRGAFNQTHGATLGGHVIKHAVERAGVEPGEVEDVIMECAMPEGATGHNVARQAAIRAGLPVTTGGVTVNRFCSSGLQAISMAAQRVVADGVPVMVAGGLESISMVQNQNQNTHHPVEDWLGENKPEIYMSMIDTAKNVAKRYNVDRDSQDSYALESQMRTAAAQQAGRFDDEIVPLKSVKLVTKKATGQTHEKEVCIERDEGNRPDTAPEGLRKRPNAALSRWEFTGVLPWRAANPMRWGSDRSSPCRDYSNVRVSRLRISICGSSTKRSRFR